MTLAIAFGQKERKNVSFSWAQREVLQLWSLALCQAAGSARKSMCWFPLLHALRYHV